MFVELVLVCTPVLEAGACVVCEVRVVELDDVVAAEAAGRGCARFVPLKHRSIHGKVHLPFIHSTFDGIMLPKI